MHSYYVSKLLCASIQLVNPGGGVITLNASDTKPTHH